MFVVQSKETVIINNSTKETAVRRTGSVECACPQCGDRSAHPAVQFRAPLKISCMFCGHTWGPTA